METEALFDIDEYITDKDRLRDARAEIALLKEQLAKANQTNERLRSSYAAMTEDRDRYASARNELAAQLIKIHRANDDLLKQAKRLANMYRNDAWEYSTAGSLSAFIDQFFSRPRYCESADQPEIERVLAKAIENNRDLQRSLNGKRAELRAANEAKTKLMDACVPVLKRYVDGHEPFAKDLENLHEVYLQTPKK